MREQASIDHFGRDPLSSLRGTHIVGGVAETGLVYSSIVYAPSPVSYTHLRAHET